MRCRRVEDLLPLHVGGDLEPALAAAVAEHLRGCLPCARALRAHQAALAAFRSLRELVPAEAPARAEQGLPQAGPSSVLWERVRARMHEEAPVLAAPSPARTLRERWAGLSAGISPRLKIAAAAAVLGASLLALGWKLAGIVERGSIGAPEDVRREAPLLPIGLDERALQRAVVLDPVSASGEDALRPAPGTKRQPLFVGRTGPNSNY